MRPIGNRIVNADTAAIQLDAIEFLDAASGFLNSGHGDESKPSGAVRLSLVINNDHFFDTTEATKLFI